MQCITIYASNHCQRNISLHTENYSIKRNNHHILSSERSILIRSNRITINYPQKIQFSGNVHITQNDHTLISDELTMFYNKENNLLHTVYAHGHIRYNNNYIKLTGQQAYCNIHNKNIDINKGTYHLMNLNIHGSANSIMQRENNRYTIIKHGNFTSCFINENYWNITGSKIILDYTKNNIDIWNARFKIKKIPILYIPYLSFPLNQENILAAYIPNIKYSNNYGLIFKIPCSVYLSKYCSGNITSYYSSNIGVLLQTKIHYSIYPDTGSIIFDIIKNNQTHKKKPLYKKYHEKLGNLCWQHNSFTHKKWNFHAYFVLHEHSNFSKENENFNHINTINNHINQKLIYTYHNKYWNASIAYLGATRNIITKNNYNNYATVPQLTLNSFYNFYIQKKTFTIKIFNQLTKFMPDLYSSPEAIRIHVEPSVLCTIHNNWSNINIETKLKFTHYQQNNINYYNNIQHIQYPLRNTVNRIIPQFKIHEKIVLTKKTHMFKTHQYFLESKLQYLYVPYYFQENIYIYDSSRIYRDYNNFFNDSTYSGLDRITPANQITGNITFHCLDNTYELFYISIGQILNFSQSYLNKINNIIYYDNPSSNFKLLSGVNHWNINDQWHVHTEIQYDMKHHNFPCNTTILEYVNKNNYTFQTHYRYINAQYIQKILFDHFDKSIFHKTIKQFGVLIYIPIYHNWKISISHYHNIKTKKIIDQIIGIQYYTSCWNASTIFERKIIGINKKYKKNIYENKIKLDIKISHSKNNLKSNSYEILNMSMLPYQHVF